MKPPPRRSREAAGPRFADAAADQASRAGTPKWKRTSHYWLRWAHVYISMFSLLAMLFFGITGITLNHPTWGVGEPTVEVVQGNLPERPAQGKDVELLAISEFIRDRHGVSGQVTDFTAPQDDGQGTIAYRAPGYSADLFFDTNAGTYELTVSREGFVAVMNELHQGRDSGTAWRWVIDVSGVLLVVVALTGLGIQFFLRKRRFSALSLSVAGAVVTVVFILIAWSGGAL